MKLNKIIELVIYPFDVMISINETDKEFKKAVKNYDMDDDIISNFDKYPTNVGRTTILESNQTIIRTTGYTGTNKNRGTIAHEIFHATAFVLYRMGINLTLDSDEAFAYLNQYLTEQIYNLIDKEG